jgi:hypothetical protein
LKNVVNKEQKKVKKVPKTTAKLQRTNRVDLLRNNDRMQIKNLVKQLKKKRIDENIKIDKKGVSCIDKSNNNANCRK